MASQRGGRSLAWRDPLDAFAPLADEPFALLLISAPPGRWSFIAAAPDDTVVGDGMAAFDAARALWSREPAGAAPFSGGVAGLMSYELGAAFDAAPRAAGAVWPDVALARYRAVIAFDHEQRTVHPVGDEATARALADRLGEPGAAAMEDRQARALQPARPRAGVEAAIARGVDYVRAGDVFQVNLAQRFNADLAPGDTPFAAFTRLWRTSPAPFAAFFRLDADHAVATHSPERFLALSASGTVETRPIKGTRPRGGDPEEDAALAADLVASEKDRAENLMIVDLMRNDLARVCTPGSVRAPSLFALETYANVHHLVSTVTGQLAADRTPFDLIAATFPPGSVTGAPKVRAMEIIAEEEGEARGPYCGAIGYIDGSGAMDLNVMIRTIAFVRDGTVWRATARSGGGVVADSAPEAEYDEHLHKIASIAAALAGAP